MKNYILLLLMMMTAGMVSGQAKVYSTGKIVLGDNTGLTPIDELHVNGRARMTDGSVINDGGSASIMFNREDESAFIIGAGVNAGMTWDNQYNFELRSNLRSRITDNRYISNGANRFKILGSNGNVGIGRSAPIEKLDVNGSIRYNGGSYNASDKRLKSNINNFQYGLDQVLELNPVSYIYNGKAGIQDHKQHVGLLAQELQKVAPALVTSFEHIEYLDQEETKVKSKEEYLQIEESSIKYMLMNAIKEQQSIIDDLQAQITELKEVVSNTSRQGLNTDFIELSDETQNTLGQNTPNPYHEGTVIEYNIAKNAVNASMNFYNLQGQLIKAVSLQNGAGKLTVSADELPSGTYTYSLEVDGEIINNKKMVKMR